MKASSVYIVLATFNGERFLAEQIQSIQAQSWSDWTLLISDDGSSDNTASIIAEFCANDVRIEYLEPREGPAGHAGNFEYLLSSALDRGADFIFLADQDDIWLPEKVGLMLDRASSGDNGPLAIFSDLEVVDAAGRQLGGFLEIHRLQGPHDVKSLLSQNTVVGCSTMVNASLLSLALPFPEHLQNHDWWLGLCAAASGSLLQLPEKLVRYRQHEGNVVGALGTSSRILLMRQILQRQRRVFRGKLGAVEELIRRLNSAGSEVPEVLPAWWDQFSTADGWSRPWQLLRSEFKPGSRQLLLVQLLALSPLVND